jgi:hypothetical protein
MSSLEKADYECPVDLNTSEREGVNKQNDLKQEFLFLKDPPLKLREGWVKIWSLRTYDDFITLYSPQKHVNSSNQ